jgi:flagellar basal body rod protein FlgG
LDRVAADIANAGTAGYKGERSTTAAANRPRFDVVLNSAVDVAEGPTRLDFRPGTIATTGQDLDLALEGRGFFVVDTPAGPRFTRNGHFERAADGTLQTSDGMTVEGENGPLRLGTGAVTVDPDGTVRTGASVAGRLRLVDFDNYTALVREGASRFSVLPGTSPTPAPSARVRGGALEGANISIVERIAHLTEVSRSFEALQRGVSVLMNDIDGRAISELGRR